MLNELATKRLEICKKCPLYTENTSGAICDSKKYMNSEGDWSYFKKEGYRSGCGCFLPNKIQGLTNKCPHNKW